jgi:hypothetical protein
VFREILHVYRDDVKKALGMALRRPIPLATGDTPVRTDVFLHRLEPHTLDTLSQCVEQGLTPSRLDFAGDDDAIVILRFTRTRAGEA